MIIIESIIIFFFFHLAISDIIRTYMMVVFLLKKTKNDVHVAARHIPIHHDILPLTRRGTIIC